MIPRNEPFPRISPPQTMLYKVDATQEMESQHGCKILDSSHSQRRHPTGCGGSHEYLFRVSFRLKKAGDPKDLISGNRRAGLTG